MWCKVWWGSGFLDKAKLDQPRGVTLRKTRENDVGVVDGPSSLVSHDT